MMKSKQAPQYWPTKLLPEGKVFGGKSYLARRIWQHAPKGTTRFLDAFGGMGSITYNAPAGLQEHVFLEKDWHRYNLKHVVKHRLPELLGRLEKMRYCEETFKWACGIYDEERQTGDNHGCIESAVVYLCVSKMSRGGLPRCGFSFTPETTRLRGGQQAEKNAWEGMIGRFPKLSERLQPVDIINGLAEAYLKLIECRHPKDWFVYMDPPYLAAVRSTKAEEYGDDEMTFQQHEELVAQVKNHPSKIAISHYPHKLYDGLGWHRVDFSMPNHSGQNKTKQRRTEALYMNY
jgi:site-specific DNA-adenine methylase